MTTAYVGALLVTVVLIWGVTWPVMKVGLVYIEPLYFGALRMLVGAGCVFLLLGLTSGIRMPGRADVPIVLSVGLLQMAIPTALMHFSLVFVDAGRASLLAFTHPIWIAPAAVVLLKEPLTRGTVAGLVVGTAGLMVLFNPLSFDWSDGQTLVGNGLLILAAISWAAGIVHVRYFRWTSGPLAMSPWQMLVAGVLLLALAAARETPGATRWTPELVQVLLFVGVAATAFCYWGAVTVSRHLPSLVAALGFLGVPVVGILSSAYLLGEPLTPTLLAGTVLILFGLVVMTVLDGRARARSGR